MDGIFDMKRFRAVFYDVNIISQTKVSDIYDRSELGPRLSILLSFISLDCLLFTSVVIMVESQVLVTVLKNKLWM